MLIDCKYNLGDIFYLKTDTECHARMLTAIQIGLNGSVIYKLSFGTIETWHYEQEFSDEKVVQ